MPDYMTYRKERIAKRKGNKIQYTLEITQNLPKPNFNKARAKILRSHVPDALENQLKEQVIKAKENQELKDNAFMVALKKAAGKGVIERLKPVLKRH